MTEGILFCLGFVSSAAIFYNIGVIRTQSKYLDEVIKISLKNDRLSAINRLEKIK